MKEKTTKKGRRGKYEEWLKEENLELIKGWCRNGLSIEQVAYNMCISKDTLIDWRKRFPEIMDAMKIGREAADLIIQNALFERARGFTVKDVKETVGTKGTESVTMIKTIPGDVNAMMFWLSRRQPDVWKEKKEEIITADADIGGVILVPEIKE